MDMIGILDPDPHENLCADPKHCLTHIFKIIYFSGKKGQANRGESLGRGFEKHFTYYTQKLYEATRGLRNT